MYNEGLKNMECENKLHSFPQKPKHSRKTLFRSEIFQIRTSLPPHPYYSISIVASTNNFTSHLGAERRKLQLISKSPEPSPEPRAYSPEPNPTPLRIHFAVRSASKIQSSTGDIEYFIVKENRARNTLRALSLRSGAILSHFQEICQNVISVMFATFFSRCRDLFFSRSRHWDNRSSWYLRIWKM